MKCATCSNGAQFGNRHCVACLEKARERSAKRYAKNKIERKCKTCSGVISESKGVYCSNCRKERKAALDERKGHGLCVTCGKEQPKHGQKCSECYANYINGNKERRDRRYSEGKCTYCENKRVTAKLCLKHYLSVVANNHKVNSEKLQIIFENQENVCPYTGRRLELGVNSSLDHIVPKSRGGSMDANNVQWVFHNVNFMKQDMLDEEFLKFIKEIYEYRNLNEVDF